MKHIVVFGPYANLIPHFETELEIVQRHLDAGDRVVFLGCDSDLSVCFPNRDRWRPRCVGCISRRKHGLSLLNGDVESRSFVELTPADEREMASLPSFVDREALKSYVIENFDIGMATLSSLITFSRDPRPELVDHQELVADLLENGLKSYRSMQNYLDAHPETDRVYVFNGRFSELRAVLRACQSRDVECVVHERGSSMNHYELFYDTTSHDLEYIGAQIREAWAQARPDERETAATRFFESRAKGRPLEYYSFVSEQRRGQLPDGWDPAKRNVAIFTSSEDELEAISDEWRNPVYESQTDGLRRLVEDVTRDPRGVHLWVRVHPNMAGTAQRHIDALMELATEHATFIGPEDSVSTYDLMAAADAVVTFGSTMGIEAAFWGRPSILVGMAFYRSLGSTSTPASHEEVLEQVYTLDAPPPREGALMYGHYIATRGTRYKYYSAEDFQMGSFKGRLVRVRYPLRGLQLGVRALRKVHQTVRRMA